MLETLSTVGGFLSGAGSFLGGLGIGGGKKSKTPSMEEQLQAQRASQRELDVERPSWIRAGAEKAGLHPLAVMGISPASGGNFYLDGGQEKKGIDLQAMGQGIDRMANAGRTGIQRKLDDLALEQAQLSNDYLRVQIAGAQKAIAKSGATTPMGGADLAGNASSRLPLKPSDLVEVVKDEQVAKNPKDTGKTAGSHAGFMTIDLGNGQTAEVPKTDEGWAEAIGELPFFYKYPKMAEIMSKRWQPTLNKKQYSKKWLAPYDPRRYKK